MVVSISARHRPRKDVQDVRAHAWALYRPIAHNPRTNIGAAPEQLAGEHGCIAAASLPASFEMTTMRAENRRRVCAARSRRLAAQSTPHGLAVQYQGAPHARNRGAPAAQPFQFSVAHLTVGVRHPLRFFDRHRRSRGQSSRPNRLACMIEHSAIGSSDCSAVASHDGVQCEAEITQEVKAIEELAALERAGADTLGQKARRGRG